MVSDEFNEDALVAEVVPTRPAEAIAATPRRFKPWHKPRKQWVRRHQWFELTERLVADTHFPADGALFRYLSMPGEDLLDVRVIQEACAAAGLELRFTGLNSVIAGSADDLQLNISENSIRDLPTIHSGSRILREKFQSIAEPQSLAFAEIRNSGPFNAINIDLCDHIALREQRAGGHTIIDALAQIVGVQLEHAMHPWLLFITTRIAPGQVDAANLRALIAAVQANINASQAFTDRAGAVLKVTGQALDQALADPDNLDSHRFKDLFCLGFGKWLLSYIEASMPARSLTMLPSCFYSVHNGRPDMLSLAFRCDIVRQPPADPFGIIRNPLPAGPAGEVEMGLRIAEQTGELTDLDAMLAAEPEVFERMTAESEALLRAANYPVDDPTSGYRAWLARGVAA